MHKAAIIDTLNGDALVALCITDDRGVVVNANKAFRNMLGYPPHSLQRRTILDLTHPDDKDFLETYVRALPLYVDGDRIIFRLVDRSNEEKQVRAIATVRKNDKDEKCVVYQFVGKQAGSCSKNKRYSFRGTKKYTVWATIIVTVGALLHKFHAYLPWFKDVDN